MLVAGVTAGEELCVVVENGSVDQRGALGVLVQPQHAQGRPLRPALG